MFNIRLNVFKTSVSFDVRLYLSHHCVTYMMQSHDPVVRPPPPPPSVCFPGPSGDFGVVVCGAGPWPHPFGHAHFVVSVADYNDQQSVILQIVGIVDFLSITQGMTV